MDRVIVEGLRVEAIIGVHDWERQVRQELLLDLEISCDVAGVASADDLALTVDYSALAERVEAFIYRGEYRLLETLAEETAAMILRDFGASWLRLKVRKTGAVSAATSVGIVIERSQADH
jgi:dihydroneopterin aldolase